MPEADLIVVAIAAPLLIGIYHDGRRVETLSDSRPASDALAAMLDDILGRCRVRSIAFARGPGSFMAIKVAYVTLATLAIARGIELLGCDGFAFNGGDPIRATGQNFFVKQGEAIRIERFETPPAARPFALPEHFDRRNMSGSVEPMYILPAI